MATSNHLTEGSIPKNILLFSIPLFLGNLFQQLYNVVDSLVVGQFLGKTALAAVTSTGSLIFLIVGFFTGTALGAGVVIARYFGANDYQNVRKSVHTDMAFGIVCGLLMTAIGMIFTPQILRLMGTPEDVFVQSSLYLRIYFAGSLTIVLYNVCMGILQAVGDSRHPLYYLIFSSVVNVVLDYLFIGIMGKGVAFAAIATVLSQLLAVLLCLLQLMRTKDVYQLHLGEIGFDTDILKQIIQIGLPSGLQNSIISIANVFVQSNINSFGSDAMAGCGAYFKIEGFAFLPITSISLAMTTFVGQNLGARKHERTKKGAAFGIAVTAVVAELIGIVVYLFMPELVELFSSDPAVMDFGIRQAHTEALFFCLLAFSHAAAGVLRGAGKSTVPMYVMLVCWCVIRISYITIATRLIPRIETVFWAYPLTWSLSTLIFLTYILRADWLHNYDREKE